MWTALLFMTGGLVLLYFGAEWLVRGAASLALNAGLSPLVVGLTVVAYGTSAPELVVSVDAALAGKGDIAVGNVVGSNICNIGIVLGVAALVRPLHVKLQMVRIHMPILIFAALLLTAFLLDGEVNRIEGLVLLLGLVLYTTLNYFLGQGVDDEAVLEEFAEVAPRGAAGKVAHDLAIVAGGLAVLILGGHLLLKGAVVCARELGISEAVIGLTVVAFGTSAPDLVASVVAALRKHGDLAIGNAIGSVMFNLLNVMGLAALAKPLIADGIGALDYLVMLAMILLTLPLMRSGYVLRRWEGGLFVALYVAYIALRWP